MDRGIGASGALTAPVLTVTLNPSIDLDLTVPDWPRGDFTRATAVRRAAGGKGINVSRVLAALGVASTAFCPLGGPDADVFLSLLEGAPFEPAPVRLAGPTRTCITITCEHSGQRIKINQPGPTIAAKQWRQIEAALRPLLARREWVVLAGSLPPGVPQDAYARLVRLARRAGARTALDCAGESLLAALAEKPDLVKPNRVELGGTLGEPCRSRRAVLAAARRLQIHGAKRVIISHGGGVCLALEGDAVWEARPPVIRPGGLMGGGDSLLAGLVAGLLRGLEFPQALRRGIASGSAAAAAPDTVFPRRAEIRRFEPQIKIRRI